MGKPPGKEPLVRPRRRLEDNIKCNHKKVGCGDGKWMEMAQVHAQWSVLVFAMLNQNFN
jgi:hypothetical protein